MSELALRLAKATEKLAHWRTFFASWQLGTRSNHDGELRAVKDHREVTMFTRAELNALVGLLIDKKVFTVAEWQSALLREAIQLDKDYEDRFKGFSTSLLGLQMKMPDALNTMTDLDFPK